MKPSETSLADSQQIFNQARIKNKQAQQQYYQNLQQYLEQQFSVASSEHKDFDQITGSLLRQVCCSTLNIVESLETKIQVFKQKLQQLSKYRESIIRNKQYRHLRNNQEIFICEWLIEIGLVKSVQGLSFEQVIHEARFNYMNNQISWPSLKVIENIDEFHSLKQSDSQGKIEQTAENKSNMKEEKENIKNIFNSQLTSRNITEKGVNKFPKKYKTLKSQKIGFKPKIMKIKSEEGQDQSIFIDCKDGEQRKSHIPVSQQKRQKRMLRWKQ